MWFKNLQLYRLTEDFTLNPEQLDEKLQQNLSRPVQGLDSFSLGWDRPLGRDGESLVHAANGCILVCARREERVLPAAVIRDALDEKVAEIEDSEARTVRGKEKRKLRDEITVSLLPRAFTRSARTFAYIDPQAGWVVVDSVSAKKAEDLLSLMRKSLGSFPVKPFEVQQSPSDVLTHWLQGESPTDFALMDECELREIGEEGGIVRLRRHDLDGNEIAVHLKAGKRVVKLAVQFEDRLGCVLADDVSVKRVKFLDVVQEASADANAEDVAAQFDVDFALMTLELRRFIERLVEVYGGLDKS